jgi:hypothetical protein
MAERPAHLAAILAANGLCGIFYDKQTFPLGDLVDCGIVGGQAEQVDRNDCLRLQVGLPF